MNRAERRRAMRENKKRNRQNKFDVLTMSPPSDESNPCPNGHPDQMLRWMNGLPVERCPRCGETPRFEPAYD